MEEKKTKMTEEEKAVQADAEALQEEALEATAGGVAYSKGDPGNPGFFRPGA